MRNVWTMTGGPDDSPFVEAITKNQPALRAFCRAHITRRSDADDTLQKTNLKLWEKREDWDASTPFLPWAFTVARYTILSHFRDRGRERLVFHEDVAEMMAAPLTQSLDDYSERVTALRHCLASLNKRKRQLIRLHYHEGRALKEMAHATGRSLSAIKVALHRTRGELALCIRKRLRPAN